VGGGPFLDSRGDAMLHGKKIVVVMPGYRAAATLARTFQEIPQDLVDEVLLVDDASDDGTVDEARRLGIRTYTHRENLGYGANQKTCYTEALREGAEIVIMIHPDYQYDPRLIGAMAAMVASGVYDVVLGSRIIGDTARTGGMPLYKYAANRGLTALENLLLGTKLSEFHTGFRAFSRKVLETLPLLANSDDFVFDNQMLSQAVAFDFRIGEISCPTRYFPEASSISFRRSIVYGLGVVRTSFEYRLWRWGLTRPCRYTPSPTARLVREDYAESRHSRPGAADSRDVRP